MKILISPAHYLIDLKSQSEFFTVAKVLFSLAEKNPHIDFYVLCGFCADKETLPENIRIFELYSENNFKMSISNRIIFYIWLALKSISLSRKNKFDLLWHFMPSGEFSFNIFILFRLYKLFGIKKLLIGCLQGYKEETEIMPLLNEGAMIKDGKIELVDKNSAYTKYLFKLLSKFSRAYFNNFDHFIFQTEVARKKYSRFLKKNFNDKNSQVIPVGIDCNKFLFTSKEISKKINFLFVGSLTENKNVEKMLMICKEYASLSSNFLFHVIGEGSRKLYLKNMAKELDIDDKVIFYGAIPHAEIQNYYKDANYLFMFSRYESFGHPVLEAWATGTFFAGSDIPTFSEKIKNGENGLLFKETEDACIIAKRLFDIKQGFYDQIVKNGYETVKQYNWNEITSRYYEAITE